MDFVKLENCEEFYKCCEILALCDRVDTKHQDWIPFLNREMGFPNMQRIDDSQIRPPADRYLACEDRLSCSLKSIEEK